MDLNQLEELRQKLRASENILTRIMEQAGALSGQLASLEQALSNISMEESKLLEPSDSQDAGTIEEPVDHSIVFPVEINDDKKESKLTVAERFGQEKQTVNLNEQFGNRFRSNLLGSVSLNDRFRFQRELFHGSQIEMNDALSDLENCQSFGEAWDYVCHKLDGELLADESNETLQDFHHILELHFS